MPEWLVPVLSAAKDPDTRGWLLTLVLIVVVDRRLHGLSTSVERMIVYVTNAQAHQTSRMQEIRNALYNMAGWDVPNDEPLPHPDKGGHDAQAHRVSRRVDRSIHQRGGGV